MARLNRADSLALLHAFVRAQNLLKGICLDQARMAFPPVEGDRQFKQFEKSLKDRATNLRQVFARSLADEGVIEVLSNEDIFNTSLK